MRDLLLGEVLLVLAGADVEAGAGDQAAVLDRVAVGMAQGDELVVLLEVREVELCRPRRPSPAASSRASSSPGTSASRSALLGAL